MYPWEEQALEQVGIECGIPQDWKMGSFTGIFRLLENVGEAAKTLAELTGHDEEALRRILYGITNVYHMPEGSRALTFTSPDGDESLLMMASPRDHKVGTRAYLDRLDLEQLEYARDEAASRIKTKTQEPMRTVWRVCDDLMCRGNFRDTEYLKAVAFMAKEGERLYAEFGEKEPKRANDLKLELVPMKVPESEYESWFA